MCYVIITSVSLVWFLCTLVADMLVAVALVTPKWLIGPSSNWSVGATPTSGIGSGSQRQPSVGIYTRCKQMHQLGYHCGRFDLDGFATDGSVYPLEWKLAMFFMSLGFVLLSLTVAATLLTCCRQSAFGKSIHNMTACAQVLSGECYQDCPLLPTLPLTPFIWSGITVMLAMFLHPLGWRAQRVQRLCGTEAEPFYPADCSMGKITAKLTEFAYYLLQQLNHSRSAFFLKESPFIVACCPPRRVCAHVSLG